MYSHTYICNSRMPLWRQSCAVLPLCKVCESATADDGFGHSTPKCPNSCRFSCFLKKKTEKKQEKGHERGLRKTPVPCSQLSNPGRHARVLGVVSQSTSVCVTHLDIHGHPWTCPDDVAESSDCSICTQFLQNTSQKTTQKPF